MPTSHAVHLSSLLPHQRARIGQVPSRDPEKLRYLGEARIVPGAEVEVIETYPYGGGTRVRLLADGTERVLSRELADEITVYPQVAEGRSSDG